MSLLSELANLLGAGHISNSAKAVPELGPRFQPLPYARPMMPMMQLRPELLPNGQYVYPQQVSHPQPLQAGFSQLQQGYGTIDNENGAGMYRPLQGGTSAPQAPVHPSVALSVQNRPNTQQIRL